MRIRTFLLLLAITIPAGWFLFGPGYYNMHDDLQVMRIFEMEKCLADGQIPCRWAPDMAYGYGQAMFNFYSAFPYYLGALIRIITPLSIIGSVKFTFFLSLLVSAIGIYLLAKEFWGKLGGFLSAVLYVYAPYHALDIYVRGALAESWAIATLPLLWFSFYKLIKKPDFLKAAFASVVFAVLLTTHNISTLIYAPFTILWVAFWLFKEKGSKNLIYLLISGLLGIGLASFFILPALYEQRFVQIENLTKDYSDYHAHFVNLNQLFVDRSWGDGPSIWGDNDDISFQIGWPHWWIAILVGLLSIYFVFRKKKILKPALILCSLVFFTLSAFLTHWRSLPLWEKVPLLPFVQFPWRFLGLAIFFLSFAGGALAWFKVRYGKFLTIISLVLAVALNISYFEPVHYSRLVRDEEKLSGVAFELQQKAAILDYLPKNAETVPPAVAPATPNILEGDGLIRVFTTRSDRFSFEAEMYNKGKIVIPVMYFPGWITILDGKEVPLEIHGAHGLIKVGVPEGRHVVRGRFTNTLVRTIGNTLTALSCGILLTGCLIASSKKTYENTF